MNGPEHATHGEQLGERISRLRSSAGLSTAGLARRVGIRGVQMSNYELGRYKPRIAVLGRIAVALGTTTDYLVSGRGGGGLEAIWPLVNGLPAEQRANLMEFLAALLKVHSLTQSEQRVAATPQA
jgi:transcriptional regulator with XRE-family HTH domain